jgi:hypothetical protein
LLRTGRAFHITKEIVEEEGVYEEVDERYQAKRILMLQNCLRADLRWRVLSSEVWDGLENQPASGGRIAL